MESLRRVKEVALYPPEPFEWLRLSSGMVEDGEPPAVPAEAWPDESATDAIVRHPCRWQGRRPMG